jgi:hypothetical protein
MRNAKATEQALEYFGRPKTKKLMTISVKPETIKLLQGEAARLSKRMGKPIYMSGIIEYLIETNIKKARNVKGN